MKKNFMFTSESVTEGHPDKMCDQISDAVVDHFLEQDPYARVRAECAISTSILFIAARYAAKNVVAAGLADECEVQLSYSIGFAGPVSIMVETFGTGKREDEEIAALLEEHFEFRLAGILRNFNLRHLPSLNRGGFYRKLAAYGQVGRADLNLPWEATDKVGVL